ncbi:unnamed protein product [Protopolystoma xenopodis]|uniref:Uncharacterized protein n=1 Tax=Protopolystoma xenopodis TaxID=117903 RepID=A0A3S5BTP7_9PLAT|nr:unnamed protein product [Protopolystoma xenopodis]
MIEEGSARFHPKPGRRSGGPRQPERRIKAKRLQYNRIHPSSSDRGPKLIVFKAVSGTDFSLFWCLVLTKHCRTIPHQPNLQSPERVIASSCIQAPSAGQSEGSKLMRESQKGRQPDSWQDVCETSFDKRLSGKFACSTGRSWRPTPSRSNHSPEHVHLHGRQNSRGMRTGTQRKHTTSLASFLNDPQAGSMTVAGCKKPVEHSLDAQAIATNFGQAMQKVNLASICHILPVAKSVEDRFGGCVCGINRF